jgi:ethanolaminephosphotransferase
MCVNYAVVAYFSNDFSSSEVPSWVWWFSTAALWTYQTLDAIDGKQARRTGSSSPLGQLFDHGCDALTTTIVACSVHSAMGFRGAFSVVVHTLHLGPFFVSNWEE